jgi:hypothetical protein
MPLFARMSLFLAAAVLPVTLSAAPISARRPRAPDHGKAKAAANLSPNDKVFAVLFMLPR